MATQAPFSEPQNLWSKPPRTLVTRPSPGPSTPTLSSAGSPDHLPLPDPRPSSLFPLRH